MYNTPTKIKSPQAAATASELLSKPIRKERKEHMNHTIPKSILAIIEESDGNERGLKLRGKRASIFLQLFQSEGKGINRHQDGLPDERLAQHMCDLRKKPLDIESVGSKAYPAYVLHDRISEITITY